MSSNLDASCQRRHCCQSLSSNVFQTFCCNACTALCAGRVALAAVRSCPRRHQPMFKAPHLHHTPAYRCHARASEAAMARARRLARHRRASRLPQVRYSVILERVFDSQLSKGFFRMRCRRSVQSWQARRFSINTQRAHAVHANVGWGQPACAARTATRAELRTLHTGVSFAAR